MQKYRATIFKFGFKWANFFNEYNEYKNKNTKRGRGAYIYLIFPSTPYVYLFPLFQAWRKMFNEHHTALVYKKEKNYHC